MIRIDDKEYYCDFLKFKDDDDVVKEIYVKILRVDTVVEFETIGGNIITIPASKLIRIKKRKKDGGVGSGD